MSESMHPTLTPYIAWIRERLPGDIPAALTERCLTCFRGGRVEGWRYWRDGERVFEARSEGELRRRLYSELTYWLAQALEEPRREQEKARWRYVFQYVKVGGRLVRLPPRENERYVFGVAFDHRKWWMEEHLRLLRGVATLGERRALIRRYGQMLNSKFPDKHWAYLPLRGVFIEVSRSQERGFEDALAGRRPKPWTFPKEPRFFVLRKFLRFARQWFLGF